MKYIDPKERYSDEVGQGYDPIKLAHAIAEPDEPDNADETANLASKPISFN